ncbi:MAG: MBL fold metallo-hydrolase [Acidimicrobiales bacterium]
MYFHQYELGCLSVFSYLIGDRTTGRAVVVDPQRDISGYLADAKDSGLHIEQVIETHVHADFLSGHLELAKATGATISYGLGAQTDFPIQELVHGERIVLGEVVIEVRATPGHTPESISLVVWEHTDDVEPWAVLTGDALFIGDVGRPDLLASAGHSPDDLGRQLYRSLREQILTLPDHTRVYPAHGAGSACGKQLSTATESTIGQQRETNYALAPMSEDDFVAVVTEGQSVAPAYFGFAADANRRARGLLDDEAPTKEVTLDEAQLIVDTGGVVLDTRSPETFASGHLVHSINVGLDGRFAEYAGDVISPKQPIVLVTDPGRETEARVRLARIGFDKVAGYLPVVEQILIDRPNLAGQARRISASDLATWINDQPDLQVIDVRTSAEQGNGVIPGAHCLALSGLLAGITELGLNPEASTVVYCAGGYRSSIAASTLRQKGFTTVADLLGGFQAWAGDELVVDAKETTASSGEVGKAV